jgi:hypothetical protein
MLKKMAETIIAILKVLGFTMDFAFDRLLLVKRSLARGQQPSKVTKRPATQPSGNHRVSWHRPHAKFVMEVLSHNTKTSLSPPREVNSSKVQELQNLLQSKESNFLFHPFNQSPQRKQQRHNLFFNLNCVHIPQAFISTFIQVKNSVGQLTKTMQSASICARRETPSSIADAFA